MENQNYRLDRIESDISKIQESIKVINDHSGESSIAFAKLEQKVDTAASDIKAMKDSQTWLVRLVIGLIIVAIINIIINKT